MHVGERNCPDPLSQQSATIHSQLPTAKVFQDYQTFIQLQNWPQRPVSRDLYQIWMSYSGVGSLDLETSQFSRRRGFEEEERLRRLNIMNSLSLNIFQCSWYPSGQILSFVPSQENEPPIFCRVSEIHLLSSYYSE